MFYFMFGCIYPVMCIAYNITSSPLDIIYKHFSSSYFMS